MKLITLHIENYPVIVKRGIPHVLARKVEQYPLEPKVSLLKTAHAVFDLLSIKNIYHNRRINSTQS